ncbi:hypothetical protein [Tomitella fengzijianii]|uniref:PknH-like extracellular domain-containing protein n=1 Tax=Tomitella fengzijianii TaxID=2597660 RepID=A0A516X642_9ACTN|nr:hypothetical protein [Tomitella fengzijianii]QDQ98547.1 hypothetical protein FO059_16000 [Tomitella fengzijianii]
MKRSVVAVGGVLAAAVLAGCGSGGDGSAPDGEYRPLGFGTDKRIEMFVPQGWSMINQNDFVPSDPAEATGQSGVTYALLDRSRIPEELGSKVATDDAAKAEFAAESQQGAAITAQFTEITPCDKVESMLQAQRDAVDFDSIEDADSGLGDHRKLGESTREVDGVQYRYVQYYSSIQLSSTHCVGMLLQSTLKAPDDAAVDEARRTITEVADNSRTDQPIEKNEDGDSGGN